MVPVWTVGAFESAFQRVISAASFADFAKQGAVFVVPLTPGTALSTFPFLATVICTTTIPSS